MRCDRLLLKRWGRLVLAVLVAVGGIQGLWVLRSAISGPLDSISTALIGFYLANVVAGWLLWKRPRWGLSLALILQLFQLLQIHGPTLSYHLASFAGLWVLPTDSGLEFPWSLGSSFRYSRTTGFGPSIPTGSTYVGVNLFAIAVVVEVWVLWPGESDVDALRRGELLIAPGRSV